MSGMSAMIDVAAVVVFIVLICKSRGELEACGRMLELQDIDGMVETCR